MRRLVSRVKAESASGAVPRPWWRPEPLAVVLFGAPVLVMPLLGAPAGLVWAAVAPRPELLLTREGAVYSRPEPQALIAADGWFAVVTAAAGLLCGVVMFSAARRHLRTFGRDVASLFGLTVGGLFAALSTWGAGRAMGFSGYQEQARAQPTGSTVMGYLQVHAVGLVVVWALSAVLVFTILVAARGSNDQAG